MQQVYMATVDCVPEDFESKINELHKQRRAKVLRCKNIMDKKRSYLAGKLLTYAANQLNISEDEIILAPFDWDKLTMRKEEASRLEHSVYGSISHAGDCVVVGISDAPLGIDIEQYRYRFCNQPQKRMESVARKVMNDKEYEKYKKLSEDLIKQKDFFLWIWTRKEAYSKWDGRGIAMELSKIDALKNEQFLSRKINVNTEDYIWCSIYTSNVNAKKVDYFYLPKEG